MILARDFYIRQVQTVAQDLLGRKLVRMINGCRVTGIISETEAYDGEKDLACHARSGKTQRNRVMYGESGRAYIYFTYGMHWMLNCIAGDEGYPAAVLIRAVKDRTIFQASFVFHLYLVTFFYCHEYQFPHFFLGFNTCDIQNKIYGGPIFPKKEE